MERKSVGHRQLKRTPEAVKVAATAVYGNFF